jgi:hypothetical protein
LLLCLNVSNLNYNLKVLSYRFLYEREANFFYDLCS